MIIEKLRGRNQGKYARIWQAKQLCKSCQRRDKNRYYLVVKLLRAHEGCLGIDRRRRTCKAAKRFGELHKSYDPDISEWRNPTEVMFSYCKLNPQVCKATRGEAKHPSNRRKRNQPRFRQQWRTNAEQPKPASLLTGVAGLRCGIMEVSLTIWEDRPKRVTVPLTKTEVSL